MLDECNRKVNRYAILQNVSDAHGNADDFHYYDGTSKTGQAVLI